MSEIKATRRTLVRGAAWSAPVISAVVAAPAFAASTVICSPSGCKYPGDGPHTKDYVVMLNCSAGQEDTAVKIDGKVAEQVQPGSWMLRNEPDSESTLFVEVTTADGGEWSGHVKFRPCTR